MKHLKGLWYHRTDLVRMIRDMVQGRYRASFFTQVAMIVCLLYVLMPFDFLPDFIPLLGWADDAAMIYFFSKRILTELDRYRASRQPLRVVKYSGH